MSYVHFTNVHWGLLRFLQSEGFEPKVWILVRNSHPRRWKVNWKAPEIGKLERWEYGWLNSDMILIGLTRIDVMVWHQHEDKWSYISRSSNLFVLALHRFVAGQYFGEHLQLGHVRTVRLFGRPVVLGPGWSCPSYFSFMFGTCWHPLLKRKEQCKYCISFLWCQLHVYVPRETRRLLKYSIPIFQLI